MSLSVKNMAAGLAFAVMVSGVAQAQDNQTAAAGQQAAASGPQYADRAEYDLVQAFQKETDPQKRLDLLKQWQEKYPNSAFKEQRYNFMVVTYQQKGDAQGMYNTAKEMATANPNGFGNYWLTILTPTIGKMDEATLTTGEQAANGLLTGLNAPNNPFPPAEKGNMTTAAHKTLGWVAMQRKNWDTAESEFNQVLQAAPNDAETAWNMGNVLVYEKKPEKTSAAMYYMAHAIGVTGPTALQGQSKTAADQYLRKIYNQYHGSAEGYDKLLADAKGSATPPANFEVVSKVKLAQKEAEDYNAKLAANPSLAQWNGMKELLATPDGQAKFPTDIKGAQIPTKFTGKVISAEPAAAPKKLVLSIADGTTPDATLNLSAALRCKVDPGTAVTFESASPDSFTASPYMLTLDVDRGKLSGLPAGCTAGAAPAHRPAARPGARRR